MIERFFNWLMRNKMLIFLAPCCFNDFCYLVLTCGPVDTTNLLLSPSWGEIKGQLPYKATLGKQGENLVVELKWNKFQMTRKFL